MNLPASNTPGYWKGRYTHLMDEFEQRKAEWQGAERLMLRVISRLITAASGFDDRLDPHLTQIRDLLRKGMATQALRSELDAISEALFRTAYALHARGGLTKQRKNPHEQFGPVFSFLKLQMDSSKEIAALAALQQRAERGEFVNQSAFFGALKNLLEEIVNARPAPPEENVRKPGLLGRLFGGGKKSDDQIGLAAIQKNLLALLDTVDTPIALQGQANRLRERLNAKLDEETFLSIFQDTVEFLVNIRANNHSEQQFLESFLNELTGKLIALEQQTLGVHALTKASEEGSTNLHATFADHVEKLRSTANSATDIGQLKRVLSNRLELISNYLSTEREEELKRIKETEQQVDQLTRRLHELEMEATDLRTKLRMEHNMAMRDALTGLPNRLAYNERIGQEVARWKRFGIPFCMLVWDVDHFKSINDRFGHQAGDKALVTIAQTLAASIRETDFVGRFGGEEFVMILSGTDSDAALDVADGIRARVEDCGFHSHGKPVKITISCGISQFRDDDTHDHAFERADQALYRAKREGRNRCVLD